MANVHLPVLGQSVPVLGTVAGTIPADPLLDNFSRRIRYLRVSVTDRCNYRCSYCMPEELGDQLVFEPRAAVLSFEELERLVGVFARLGVRKVRLTGGEPTVRKGIVELAGRIAAVPGIEQVVMTSNGHLLGTLAAPLAAAGVSAINVSLDTLDADKFRTITRWGDLDKVLGGIDAALAAGLHVKINTVALKEVNEDEIADLLAWAHGGGMDLTVIEVMPLGDIGETRLDQYLPLSMVRARLAERFTLEDSDYRTGGPARYVRVKETGGRLGFITPLTHNFCETCNRVRITCTGTLYMCLGHDDAADLRTPLRASEANDLLYAAINEAITRKPKGHDFVIDRRHQRPALTRHMSVTGG
jgi:cyclic pyranopterin phosphate synthase